MPGPSTGPSRGGLRGPLVEGKHVLLAARGSPGGGGGTKHERELCSHGKKRPREFNPLIKFRSSGHGGPDWARHSGVSNVSHEWLSYTHTHRVRSRIMWLDRVTQQKDGLGRWSSDRCGFVCPISTSNRFYSQLVQWFCLFFARNMIRKLLINTFHPIPLSNTFSNIQLQPWSLLKCKYPCFTSLMLLKASSLSLLLLESFTQQS